MPVAAGADGSQPLNRIAGSGRAIAAIHIGRRRAIAGDRAAGDSHRAALRVDAGRAGDRAAGNGQVKKYFFFWMKN